MFNNQRGTPARGLMVGTDQHAGKARPGLKPNASAAGRAHGRGGAQKETPPAAGPRQARASKGKKGAATRDSADGLCEGQGGVALNSNRNLDVDANVAGELAQGPEDAVRRFKDSRLKQSINPQPIHPQTGPTSEEGKRAVSQNALKHGFYARPQEDDTEFVAIDLAVFDKLEPAGIVQRQIARSIADVLWRTARREETVRALYRDIEQEQVNLAQLAVQLEFPFAKSYAPLLLLYVSEGDLLRRVRGHCQGVFSELLERPYDRKVTVLRSLAATAEGPISGQANERIGLLLARAQKVLAKDTLVQHMEVEFFQEFDAVMLETYLGRNRVGAALLDSGELMPLVECWAYRNHMQIRVVVRRMVGSLQTELLKDPGIDRARRSASSRLSALLKDYVQAAPHKLDQARSLGYTP